MLSATHEYYVPPVQLQLDATVAVAITLQKSTLKNSGVTPADPEPLPRSAIGRNTAIMRVDGIRLRWPAVAVFLLLDLCAAPLIVQAEATVGKITQVVGRAQVKRGGAELKATAPMPVEMHDEVKTFAPGQVTLQMADNSVLTLNESSVLQIDESIISGGTRTSTKIGLLGGSLRSLVTTAARGVGGSNFEVMTPNAIAGVRGTDFECAYHEGKARPGFASCFQFTDCATKTGAVVVSNNPPRPGIEVSVGPGQMTTVACLAAPLAASSGSLGVLTQSSAGGAGQAGVLGPAAIVGIGAGAAAAIGGTTAAVIESTGGGGTSSGSF